MSNLPKIATPRQVPSDLRVKIKPCKRCGGKIVYLGTAERNDVHMFKCGSCGRTNIFIDLPQQDQSLKGSRRHIKSPGRAMPGKREWWE